VVMKFILDPFYFIEGRYMKPGGKGGKAPAAPDPATTAAAQTATNKETAYWNAVLNNVNQVTPYGNLTYKQTGGGKTYNMDAYNQAMSAYNQPQSQQIPSNSADVWGNTSPNNNSSRGPMPQLSDFQTGDAPPSFTSTIDLSPDQQAILDSEERRQISMGTLGEEQIGRIRDSVSNPYSYGGLGNEVSADDIATQQSRAEEALMARFNPQFAKDEEALRTRLINQGIGQGSQAYNSEMERFNQAKNDARTQAVLSGQQYGSTAQQQALQRRNQSIQEYDAQRNAPLNEYIGLTSGVQVQNPQFSSQNYQGAQPVDYAGLINQNYQNQMSQYNAKQAGSNNMSSALFGLGGSFLSSPAGSAAVAGLFSDIRLKENVEHIGEENGFPIYKFNYDPAHPYVRHVNLPTDKTYIGVMSRDVREIMPQAVQEFDGYDRVNYDMIGVEMREAHG